MKIILVRINWISGESVEGDTSMPEGIEDSIGSELLSTEADGVWTSSMLEAVTCTRASDCFARD